jgi:hypothetical protein
MEGMTLPISGQRSSDLELSDESGYQLTARRGRRRAC